MKKKRYTIIFLSISIFIFFSCESLKNKNEGQVPAWIEKIPSSDENYEYFTASGTNKNFTLAETDAKNNLINEIIRYLGVSIKTETTTTALGHVENLEKILKSEISQSSAADIKKLKIKNRYVQKNKDNITVYILAEYDRHELYKERNRLLKLAEEKILSVIEPEKKADDFFAIKKYYSAAVYYTKAASASMSSQIENYEIKYRSNISKAKESLKNIKLDFEKSSLENPSNEFLIPIDIGTFEEGVPLLISYKTKIKNNTSIIIEGIETDKNGKAHFILHNDKIDSSGRIKIELDISEIKQILKTKDYPQYRESIHELQQIILKQAVNFELKKTPADDKKNKEKTPVSIFMEYEEQELPYTEERLKNILDDMNFKTISLKNKNISDTFFIYSKIEIEEITENTDGFLVKIKIMIEIKDKNKDGLRHRKVISKRGAGLTQKEALRSASIAAAKSIASIFANAIE